MRSAALLAVACSLSVGVTHAQTSRIDRVEQWLKAVLHHVPGTDDEAVARAGSWSAGEMGTLWIDLNHLVALSRNPRIGRFDIRQPGLEKEDQAALVIFRDAVTLGADLTSNAASVRDALDNAEPDGATALVDGTYAAMVVGESDVGRALVIVFSDGLDTSSWLQADAVLETAKRSDAVAYAVSVGRVKSEFLRDLTAFTGGRLFEIEKTANLSSIFVSVLEEFRHRYLVSYTPRGVQQNGWHRLTVRVKRNATVKARPGYLAGVL